MRDRAWLDAVRDRVLAEIAANPSAHPYLGEEEQAKRGPKPTMTVDEKRQRQNARKRKLRAEGRWSS